MRHGRDIRGPALRLLTLGDVLGHLSSRARLTGSAAQSPSSAPSAASATAPATALAASPGAASPAAASATPPSTAPSRPGGRPASSAVRAVASALMLGAALFYLAVAVKGVGGLLLGPPPEMVTTAGDLAASTRSARPHAELAGVHPVGSGTGPGDQNLELLLRPLAITGAALAGLLLLWSGLRGLRAVRDQRRWRARQVSGLIGFGLGTLAFGLGLTAADGGTAAYVGSVWHGVEPIRPSAVLALLIGSLALLLPARRRDPGPRHPARNSTGPGSTAPAAPARFPFGR
ncbi:hypothetical protein ACQP1W_07435 [Spirillospora sp. CA-255316]